MICILFVMRKKLILINIIIIIVIIICVTLCDDNLQPIF